MRSFTIHGRLVRLFPHAVKVDGFATPAYSWALRHSQGSRVYTSMDSSSMRQSVGHVAGTFPRWTKREVVWKTPHTQLLGTRTSVTTTRYRDHEDSRVALVGQSTVRRYSGHSASARHDAGGIARAGKGPLATPPPSPGLSAPRLPLSRGVFANLSPQGRCGQY